MQFHSSIADYSWQGLTSSCQHWSSSGYSVCSTPGSLKGTTLFSCARWEPLFAALPSFSHYLQLKAGLPAACSRPSWELGVFLECWPNREKVIQHWAESSHFSSHVNLFSAASYKIRGTQWTQGLKHQYGNADAGYLELQRGTVELELCTDFCTCGIRDVDTWHKTEKVDAGPEGKYRGKKMSFVL